MEGLPEDRREMAAPLFSAHTRELLWIWTTRQVKARYTQTVFGAAWVVFQPLALSAVFVLVFSGPRRRAADQHRPARAQGGARDGLRHHERQPAQALRGYAGVRLQLRDQRAGAVPGQRVQPEPRRRRGLPHHPEQDPDARAARHAEDLRRAVAAPARAGAGDRPHRLGQEHDAGGDGQPPQRERVRPRADGRGPDRVRPREQEVPGQPARGRTAHAVVRERAALGAARGPGRDPGRRDARPGDDPPRAHRRRDRPPRLRHAAHLERGQDGRPHRRRLPGGREGDGARDAVGIADRGDLADAVQDQGRVGAGRGARDHDRHPGDPQPDPREQGRADVLGDPDRAEPGHADARPEPRRPGAAQRRRGRRSARQGALPRELPRLTPGGPTMERDQASKFINDLLRLLVSRNGSDLFLTADFPPAIKVDGKVTKVSPQPLTGMHTMALARAIMNERQVAEFERTKECNFAISPKDIGRFRVNAFLQQSHVGLVLRTIPQTLPTIDSLGLPAVMKDIGMTKRGLVIMVGATGSGKSTSLAAIVDYRNENSCGHIITVEDPVEFVHAHKNCIVTQRELGIDTDSWEAALKNTLRQAPDVILMGEIRDRETMEHAVAFAETGHLCLATLHANSANQALDRIVNFFPEERRAQLLMDLSLNLRAMVSQRLVPRQAGKGRIAAVEILLNSPLISDLIFKGEVGELKELMKRSREHGMQTFDQALFDLYEACQVTYEDALRNADSVNDLRLQIKLNSQRSRNRDLAAGTEHLAIMEEPRFSR